MEAFMWESCNRNSMLISNYCNHMHFNRLLTSSLPGTAAASATCGIGPCRETTAEVAAMALHDGDDNHDGGEYLGRSQRQEGDRL
jgi:hypothetical protein